MNPSNIPYLDLAWNPGGFGCSNHCPGCWARKMAPRIGKIIGCRDCAEFKVHMHPERLAEPVKRKKPAVIGVQFTGELFDPARPQEDVEAVLRAIEAAPWHTYVFLTQRPERIPRRRFADLSARQAGNCWIGITARTGAELATRSADLWDVPARKWVSMEPLAAGADMESEFDFWHELFDGVVIGCDNRLSAGCDLSAAGDIVRACRARGIRVYVKQILTWRCPKCGRLAGHLAQHRTCPCGTPEVRFRRVLLRDPADFPADLRVRELPWKLASKEP